MIPTRLLAFAFLVCVAHFARAESRPAAVTKLKDVVVYRDDTFYCAFPSIVRRSDGELIVAFRRAPEPRSFGTTAGPSHTDPCSQLVTVRSKDGGETWTPQPALLWASPRGGLQDPCMIQLDDGSILCASYGWALIAPGARQKLKNSSSFGEFVFTGGSLYRSSDGGRAWSEITTLPPTKGEHFLDPLNRPLPAYNRGAMCQGRDGRVFWATARANVDSDTVTGVHLMTSADRGSTWTYACPIAADQPGATMSFNETSLYETPKGDLVAFLRTEGGDDHTYVARSRDGGKSFEPPQDAGWRGHPHFALRLPDGAGGKGRVLLVYGYRHAPFGIRARVLDAECSDFATAPEIILRDDGGHGDLGYPWATMLDNDRALVVYYFNNADGPRYIGGTILKVN